MKTSKRCDRCRRVKNFSHYNRHQNREDGLQRYCRQCQSEYFKEYWINHYRAERRRLRTKKRTGRDPLTPALPPGV